MSSYGILLLFCALVVTMSVYPWDGDFAKRNMELLHQLRSSLQLEIVSDTIPKAFEDNELLIRNLQGVPFSAKIKTEDPMDFKTQYAYLFDEAKLSAKLEGLCSVLPIEYWNYEWCHRREMSQFHLEQEPKRIVKSPDWSLGKYSRSVVVRDRGEVGNENAPIVKLVEYFTGGQICHENNHLRSVEVHIQCCDGLGIPNAIPSEAYQSLEKTTNGAFPLAMLNRIVEPELCAYQATVCTPLLCIKPPDDYDYSSSSSSKGKVAEKAAKTSASPTPLSKATKSPPTAIARSSSSSSSSNKKKFVDVLKVINSTCLSKQEEWWTYEVCFNKGARQVRFNLEQAVTVEGTVVQKQVLANQYILGLPPFDLYHNEEALVRATRDQLRGGSSGSEGRGDQGGATVVVKDLLSKEKEMVSTFGLVSPLFRAKARQQPNVLSLEFSQGTPCDLENLNRSVIIEIYCGAMNQILQIREDSTCRYRMKVELQAVCILPGFAPVKENVTSLLLAPLYDPEEVDSEETILSTTSSTSVTTTATVTASTTTGSASSSSSSSSSSSTPPTTTIPPSEVAKETTSTRAPADSDDMYDEESDGLLAEVAVAIEGGQTEVRAPSQVAPPVATNTKEAMTEESEKAEVKPFETQPRVTTSETTTPAELQNNTEKEASNSVVPSSDGKEEEEQLQQIHHEPLSASTTTEHAPVSSTASNEEHQSSIKDLPPVKEERREEKREKEEEFPDGKEEEAWIRAAEEEIEEADEAEIIAVVEEVISSLPKEFVDEESEAIIEKIELLLEEMGQLEEGTLELDQLSEDLEEEVVKLSEITAEIEEEIIIVGEVESEQRDDDSDKEEGETVSKRRKQSSSEEL